MTHIYLQKLLCSGVMLCKARTEAIFNKATSLAAESLCTSSLSFYAENAAVLLWVGLLLKCLARVLKCLSLALLLALQCVTNEMAANCDVA